MIINQKTQKNCFRNIFLWKWNDFFRRKNHVKKNIWVFLKNFSVWLLFFFSFQQISSFHRKLLLNSCTYRTILHEKNPSNHLISLKNLYVNFFVIYVVSRVFIEVFPKCNLVFLWKINVLIFNINYKTTTQCGNYRNLLAHFLTKISCK